MKFPKQKNREFFSANRESQSQIREPTDHPTKQGYIVVAQLKSECPECAGGFNGSTQHLLILLDEEVSAWRGFPGYGSRRSSVLNYGGDGRAVSVWRTSPGHLEGGTKAASIGYWP